MKKDVYTQMRKELTSLWRILRDAPSQPLHKSEMEIQQKMSSVNCLAIRIGGKVQQDAEQLQSDVVRFLMGELDRSEIDRMFQDALRLEQDTREL
jgi:hypothetical protein